MNDSPALRYLRSVYERGLDCARELVVDTEHPWPRHLACLLGTILEYGHAIVTAVACEAPIGVGPVLRSMLEATVDIKNLSESRLYGYNLEARTLKGTIGFLEYIRDSDQDSLAALRSNPNLANRISELKSSRETALGKLGSNNVLKLSERFAAAGLHYEYATVYAALCSEAHNDGNALAKRHVTHGDRTPPTISFHRLEFGKELEGEMKLAASLIVYASKAVHKALKSPALGAVNQLEEEINELRRQDELAV